MSEKPPANTPRDLIKRFWWVPLAGIPLVVLLMLSLRDFVHEAIALPLSYLVWLVKILIETIPQIWFLTGLGVIALVIAMRSLDRDRQPPPPAPEKSFRVSSGRINIWADRVSMLLRGKYSRHRFGYFVGKLVLDVLSYEERLGFREVERRLELGQMDAPQAVRDYLSSRLRPAHAEARPNFFTRLKRLFRLEKPPTAHLSAELETVVKFLEDQLEV